MVTVKVAPRASMPSLTSTVNVQVPTSVQTPDKSPSEDSVRPSGNVSEANPAGCDHWYPPFGGLPPVAVNRNP